MNFLLSKFYFFPRVVVPHSELSANESQIIVTLPTNEKVYFDAKTKEIVGGVLEEGPIDLSPSRFNRKFPNIKYTGSGIVLRVNARGRDPRLGQFNNAKIGGHFGNSGGKGVGFFQIGGGIAGDFPICVVPLLNQDLNREVPLWSWFCQISESTASYGGYSGAPPNEKITWGKISPDTPKFVIESDATIVAPLIFAYLLDF